MTNIDQYNLTRTVAPDRKVPSWRTIIATALFDLVLLAPIAMAAVWW